MELGVHYFRRECPHACGPMPKRVIAFHVEAHTFAGGRDWSTRVEVVLPLGGASRLGVPWAYPTFWLQSLLQTIAHDI